MGTSPHPNIVFKFFDYRVEVIKLGRMPQGTTNDSAHPRPIFSAHIVQAAQTGTRWPDDFGGPLLERLVIQRAVIIGKVFCQALRDALAVLNEQSAVAQRRINTTS